jgi:hypothetical protein
VSPRLAVLGVVTAIVACSAPPVPPDRQGSSEAPIIGGSPATAYPEAALVDMLTAGHCVWGITSWQVQTPFAGAQTASASSGAVYDWKVQTESVDPSLHDIGLIFLDTPITLSGYPAIAQTPITDGTKVVNIGRIDNGQISNSALFVGPAEETSNAQQSGFPNDYQSQDVIQAGDSGGPDELPGVTPHMIVSVNSGAGNGVQVLARVDLVYAWIAQQLQAHGGGGPPPPGPDGGSSDGGGDNDGASSAGDDAGDVVDAAASEGGKGANNGAWGEHSNAGCACTAAPGRSNVDGGSAFFVGLVAVGRLRRARSAKRRAGATCRALPSS